MNVIKKKKPKTIGCAPVDIKNCCKNEIYYGEKHSVIKVFLNSISAEEQLFILKNIVTDQNLSDTIFIQFLAVVYFYSPAKHPLKCFLCKFISKSAIQEAFTTSLAQQISSRLKLKEYANFLDIVPKAVLCIENFPAGVASIKLIDEEVAEYLVSCLDCCGDLIKNSSPPPTKKSEIFNLQHSSLRLLVHIIQKLNIEDNQKWASLFKELTGYVEVMVDDDELPMDAKCLGGILFLYMETMKCGDLFNNIVTSFLSNNTHNILMSRAGKLAVYSALATSMPVQHLLCTVDGKLAMVLLLDKLLEVGESGPSCPAIDIGVARALVQISRSLRSLPTAPAMLASNTLLNAMCTRLDDHQDCVRHLAATGLQAVVEFCVYLDGIGHCTPLSLVLSSISSTPCLSRARWSAARCLVSCVEPGLALNDVCTVQDILEALDVPHLTTVVRATLETLLARYSRANSSSAVYTRWVLLTVQSKARAAEHLLTAVLKLHPELLPQVISEPSSVWSTVSVLLCARRAQLQWRPHVTLQHLLHATVHADMQVRVQALSLVVETTKTTEPFTAEDIKFLIHFLDYNMNAHDVNYRQTVIALFIKALERASRTGETSLCATVRSRSIRNMSHVSATRRNTAAALLLAAQNHCLGNGNIEWSEEDVEILLSNLADSYETNQSIALQALQHCHTTLLQKETYSTSLILKDILKQSTSLKPADSLAAAYKLLLVLSKLPERIVNDRLIDMPEHHKEAYILCSILNNAAKSQITAAFSPLHCLSAIIHTVHESHLTSDPKWLRLVEDIMRTCESVSQSTAHVVNNASPEGYLPDSTDNSSTSEGRVMTAQMVLLCAWRSVKEASLLLGWLGGVLASVGDTRVASVVGGGLVTVLRGCQHRGAFEQAAAGLAILLNRISSIEAVSELPKQWLSDLLSHVTVADDTELQTTRRSAGLPFLIQALLSSQPHMTSQTAQTLLHIATVPGTALRRGTAINILCALFKHSSLESVMQPFVEQGLCVALAGIDADCWPERTASCLLFSALCVRVFGVVRSKDSLDVRNTLPARVFFVRYPNMYHVMLSKLQEALESDVDLLRPSVYPILLLLGRLRPSLEGTVSTLKVSSFEPLVLRCSSSAVLKTRQLCASAALALLTPTRYLTDIMETFSIISSQQISTNYCHGLLLRLHKVLQEVQPKYISTKEIKLNKDTLDGKYQENGNTEEDSDTKDNRDEIENGDARENIDARHNSDAKENTNVRENGDAKENSYAKENRDAKGNSDAKDNSCPKVNSDANRNNDAIENNNAKENSDTKENNNAKENGKSKETNAVKNSKEIVNVEGSTWLLNQPCYVLLQEYVKVLGMMLTCYPEHFPTKLQKIISNRLQIIIFNIDTVNTTPGRDLALASCMKLYIQLMGNVEIIVKGLAHSCYEVVLATLNYILKLYDTGNTVVLHQLIKHTDYNNILRNGYYYGKYLECRRKCLKLLTLQMATQRFVINDIKATDQQIVLQLLDKFHTSHIAEKHLFLKSLLNFISSTCNIDSYKLQVIKAAYSSCLDENADDVRDVVLDYLENDGDILMVDDLEDYNKFEYTATIHALLVVLLEDDDENTRQRASDVTLHMIRRIDPTLCKTVLTGATLCETDATDATLCKTNSNDATLCKTDFSDASLCKQVIPSFCGELFRCYLDSHPVMEEKIAYFIIIALLDFKRDSSVEDQVDDECRIFEQSDRSNLYLEDSLWTDACAHILTHYELNINYYRSIINNKKYSRTIQILCRSNLDVFDKLANGKVIEKKYIVSKVDRFVRKLCMS